jgi:hypothetical protein
VGLWLATPEVAAPVGESPDLVEVLVQAESAATAGALVRQVGGAVTHELGIIDAVGATLTPVQLQALLSFPDVRVFENRRLTVSLDPITKTVRDDFESRGYDGNSGSENWSTSWLALGETDGPTRGRVEVDHSRRCASGDCLQMGGDEASLDGRGVLRQADLSGATSATLSYAPLCRGDEDGEVHVQVSDDGGTTWTTLAEYDLDREDRNVTPEAFDISAFIAADTQVRIIGTRGEVEGTIYFDDIQIEYSFLPVTDTEYPTLVGAD